MSLPARVAAALAVALLLAGCTPEAPAPTKTPDAEVLEAPTATPTPTPAAPETVDAATFLVDGTPGVFDADGFWKGHYAFYTDDSKAVRCDLWVFSGDSGGATCAVTSGNEGKVSYALPATDCQAADGNNVDGYSVGINFKVFAAGYAGFTGCGAGASDFADTTKVLLDNQILVVSHDSEQFTCTVSSGIANCFEGSTGASIRFGLAVAEFAG